MRPLTVKFSRLRVLQCLLHMPQLLVDLKFFALYETAMRAGALAANVITNSQLGMLQIYIMVLRQQADKTDES